MRKLNREQRGDLSQPLTWQARLKLSSVDNKKLDAFSGIMNDLTRKIFALESQGKIVDKSLLSQKFNLTGRQFNGAVFEAEDRRKNALANNEFLLTDAQERLSAVVKDLTKKKNSLEITEPKSSRYFYLKKSIHFKSRKVYLIQDQIVNLQQRLLDKKVSVTFGSKKLWHQQYNLKANGFKTHAEWRQAWKDARSKTFYIIGSKDESLGNQTCHLSYEDKKFNLRLRMPDSFSEKYLEIKDLHFAYREEELIRRCQLNETTSDRQATNFRFHRDHKGWRIIVTSNEVSLPLENLGPKPIITLKNIGGIGIDLNADHLAIAEIDEHGNLVKVWTIPLKFKDLSKFQRRDLINKAIKKLVAYAAKVRKPLIIEDLDFQKKKAALAASHGKKYAAMLTQLAYSQIQLAINSRARKEGVEVHKVDPSYTSLIGRIKFLRLCENSVHLAAAVVIARRHFHLSEVLPKDLGSYQFMIRGKKVTLVKPVDLTKPNNSLLRTLHGRLKKAFSTGNQTSKKTDKVRGSYGMMGRMSLVSSRLKLSPVVAFPPTGMVHEGRLVQE
jgi:IS605 OrfB family transposase